MSVFGLLVDQKGGPRHHACLVIVVRDHVQEFLFPGCGTPVTEERFLLRYNVDRNRRLLLRICRKASAVLIDVLIL